MGEYNNGAGDPSGRPYKARGMGEQAGDPAGRPCKAQLDV